MAGGKVIEVRNESDWNSHLKKTTSNKTIAVVDFTASWCGPCKMISPVFEQLSGSYPNALFLKVDVDDQSEIAGSCGIRAMPTFQVFSNGKKVDEMKGADPNGLKALIEKHYVENTFSGQGRLLGSTSSEVHSASAPSHEPSGKATWSGLDESLPSTTIQIKLSDGSRLVGKFNTTQTVGDIKAYILSSKPSLKPQFQLLSSFPPKPLLDDFQTIEAAGLLSSSLSIR